LFDEVSKKIDKVTEKYKDYIENITKFNQNLQCLKDINNFEILIDIYGLIEKEEYKKAVDVINILIFINYQ